MADDVASYIDWHIIKVNLDFMGMSNGLPSTLVAVNFDMNLWVTKVSKVRAGMD